MGRSENITVFKNSMQLCKTSKTLAEAIADAKERQFVLKEGDDIQLSGKANDKAADIVLSKKRTFEAASAYKDKKVCVLNFASAKNAGGGVETGASAQEECLCRISTLYPCLTDKQIIESFYLPHRDDFKNSLYNDDLIFTPHVVVFKSDEDMPKTLSRDDWFETSVISCAAPNVSTRASISNDKLEKMLTKRIERIFITATNEGAEVLILGAFGCGVFHNPPHMVAAVMKRLSEKYANYFETIEFAVYCTPKTTGNYDAFKRVFR